MKIKDNDIMVMVELFSNLNEDYTRYQTFGYIHNNPLNKNSKLFMDLFDITFEPAVYTFKTRYLNRIINNQEPLNKGKVLIRWEK